MIELVVLDIAGTTLSEHGTVYRVLEDTVRSTGANPSADDIEQWMGASKREAIGALLAASGIQASEATVDQAFADFRQRLTAAYQADPPQPFPGVTELLQALRGRGIKVALTTGFDREVTSLLLASVGWEVPATLDAVVCIDDVAAGRPAPYLIFHAMERTGVTDVRRVLTAGDTVRDVEAGQNAGAAIVVAVTTGEVPAATLAGANPTDLLAGVTEIPELLARRQQSIDVPAPA